MIPSLVNFLIPAFLMQFAIPKGVPPETVVAADPFEKPAQPGDRAAGTDAADHRVHVVSHLRPDFRPGLGLSGSTGRP